jgi:uncharacterized phage protein gp47/JayE
LEQVVHDYIETVRPVGATVTVDSPVSKSISVTANVILDGTQLLSAVQSDFMSALSDYLKDTIFDIYNVSYAKIGSILLATKGVQDYNSLLVNGGSNSIVISDSEMPIRGTITLTEV